jgi:hypothetical protein
MLTKRLKLEGWDCDLSSVDGMPIPSLIFSLWVGLLGLKEGFSFGEYKAWEISPHLKSFVINGTFQIR